MEANMVNPTAIEQARQGKRLALTKLYATLIVFEPRETTDGDLARLLGVPKQDLRNLRHDLTEVGSLHQTRIPKGRQGLVSEWLLKDSLEIAREKLNAKWAADDKVTAERVADIPNARQRAKLNGATPDHPVVPSELVSSTGPDAPGRMAALLGSARYDPPRALLEAARQFANLHSQVEAKVKDLEALGIAVDRERLNRAVRLPTDPRLAAISEVLPYVEALERSVERLTGQNNDMREKLADLPSLTTRVNRLHEQNQRLISDNSALRTQQSAKAEVRPGKKHNGTPKPEAPKAPAPAG